MSEPSAEAAGASDATAGSGALDRRLGPLERVMRKTARDPHQRNAGMSIWILDRAPDWDRLVETWERASRLVPRIRQRLVDPLLQLGTPTWVVDPNFDLLYHLRRVRLPEPGTLRQLLDIARPVLMTPVDPARSPWELWLVEGLEGGRAALLQKGDHTVVDGQGGMRLMEVICDLARDVAPSSMPPAPEPEDVSPTAVLRADLADRLRDVPRTGRRVIGGLVGSAAERVRQPRRSASDAVGLATSMARMSEGMRSPRSPLLKPRSLSYSLDILEVAVDDLRRAGKSAGASFNDAFLASVAGGLRRYHEQLGATVETMPFGVAVSTRRAGDPVTSNRFTALVTPIPVGLADPRGRLERIHDQILSGRSEPALTVFDTFVPVAGLMPTALLTATMGSAMVDVVASSIAGPPMQLYTAGAKILRLYGIGPLLGSALTAGLISVLGTCCIGINSDPAAVTKPDVFLTCLREGFEEVLDLGGDHGGVSTPAGQAPARA